MKLYLFKFMIFTLLSVSASNAYAMWQCYVADKGGHVWESKGLTQENALAVATSFCKSFSPNGKSCRTTECVQS